MSGSTIIPWVIGNWKMNPIQAEATELIQKLMLLVAQANIDLEACHVGVAPTSLALSRIHQESISSEVSIHTIAQDVSRFSGQGAYTGEVSAELLVDSQIHHVLIGHSERRDLMGDSTQILQAKLRHALNVGMTVIYCVGESLQQREQGLAEQVVLQQICDLNVVVEEYQWEKQIIIAYEPIWAIGTGRTASSEEAQTMHAKIRQGLSQLTQFAQNIAILYGGSVKPENALEFAACPDINGALVGGASLNAESFCQIILAFAQLKK